MIDATKYKDKSIILFWGAGMSLNSGAPVVGAFMDTLYNKLGFDKDGDETKEFWSRKLPFEQNMDTLHEAAPEAFPTILKAFNNDRLKPNDAHTWLQENHQKIYAIVTTDFSNLIETALAEKNIKHQVYYKREELEKAAWEDQKNSSSIPVIKIHGSVDDADNRAITFNEIVKDENIRAVTNTVEALFKKQENKNIFFMGYSFSDPLDIVPALKTVEINKTNTITVVWHNRYAKKNEKETKNLKEAGFFDEIFHEKKENPFYRKATAGSEIWYCNTNYLFCDEITVQIPCTLPEIDEYIDILQQNQGGIENVKGWLCYDVQLYDKAIAHYEKALKIFLDTFGEKHPDVATSYNNLGNAYNSKGEYDKAIEYFEKALKIKLEILGEKHPDVAATYNNLGLAYGSKGEYNKAIEYHEKALRIRLEILGEKHPDVASTYNNLGNAYNSKGEYDKAIEYHENGLKIKLDTLGEKHPDVATSYNNLGNAYNRKGEYDKAIEYHEKALKIRLDTLGEKHPDVAMSYNNLGNAYNRKGGYDKAIEYHEKALKIKLETLGEKNPDVAGTYNNLGIAYNSKGEYNKAIEYYEKALKIKLEILGEKHPDVAGTYNNLGIAYNSKGEYDKAIENFEKAIIESLETLGEKHPDVATTYNNLGAAYGSKGEYDKAIDCYKKALNIRTDTIGEKHPDVASTYNNLGNAYNSKGEYDKAIEYFEKALKISLDTLGEKHPDVASTYNNLGLAYNRLLDNEKDLSEDEQKEYLETSIRYFGKALEIDKSLSQSSVGLQESKRNLNNLSEIAKTASKLDKIAEEYKNFEMTLEKYKKEKKYYGGWVLVFAILLLVVNIFLFTKCARDILDIQKTEMWLFWTIKISINAPIVFLLWHFTTEYNEIKNMCYQYSHKLTVLSTIKKVTFKDYDSAEKDFFIQEYSNVLSQPKVHSRDYKFNINGGKEGIGVGGSNKKSLKKYKS